MSGILNNQLFYSFIVKSHASIINIQTYHKFCAYFKVVFFVLFALVLSSIELSAQKRTSQSKIYFPQGKYHETSGWVNSAGGHIGNILGYVFGQFEVGGTLSTQIDFQRYKLINSKFGLGGGLAYKRIATHQLGYEDYSHYQFLDVYGYLKRYLNDRQRRLYIDTKLGVGIPIAKTSYSCFGCDLPTQVYFNLSPGIAVQPGIGFDFATAYKSRGGIRFSLSFNFMSGSEDSYTQENLAEPYKSTEHEFGAIPGLLTGLYFYF